MRPFESMVWTKRPRNIRCRPVHRFRPGGGPCRPPVREWETMGSQCHSMPLDPTRRRCMPRPLPGQRKLACLLHFCVAGRIHTRSGVGFGARAQDEGASERAVRRVRPSGRRRSGGAARGARPGGCHCAPRNAKARRRAGRIGRAVAARGPQAAPSPGKRRPCTATTWSTTCLRRLPAGASTASGSPGAAAGSIASSTARVPSRSDVPA